MVVDPACTPTTINGRWELKLPPWRADRAEWVTGWEVERLDSMHQHLKEGDLVFDIGAEEGDLPALWASWGCDVFLVEPNPKVWPCIRLTFTANGYTPVGWFAGFASDTNMRHPVRLDVDATPVDGWPACAWGELIPGHGFRHLAEQTDSTPQATVDMLAGQHGVPDALTIDVEGSELHVLRGAEQTLREHRPLVWVSVHPPFLADMFGYTAQDVHDYMASVGYQGTHLATDHEEHWLYQPKEGAHETIQAG